MSVPLEMFISTSLAPVSDGSVAFVDSARPHLASQLPAYRHCVITPRFGDLHQE